MAREDRMTDGREPVALFRDYANEEWSRYTAADPIQVDEEWHTLEGTDIGSGAAVGLVMLALAFGAGLLLGRWLL